MSEVPCFTVVLEGHPRNLGGETRGYGLTGKLISEFPALRVRGTFRKIAWGRKLLGSEFGRTNFARIFIFGPPDFFHEFCRRIFSPHFLGKKGPDNSSRKSPSKILQNLYNKNPRHISAEGPGQKLGHPKNGTHLQNEHSHVSPWKRCAQPLKPRLSGPLNRLNAILSLLHPLDRYRTPAAIGSAIGRPISRPISHPNTGRSPQPPRSKPLRGLNRAIVML